MTVYSCKDDFISMMTCVYEAWSSRKGHSNVRLVLEPIYEQELFTEYIYVDADEEKAEKVIRSIINKISRNVYSWVFYASKSCEADALDTIYRFLVMGFHYGDKICFMLQEPIVMRMMELRRNVGNEAHYFREFLRFVSVDGEVYVAHIEPKSDVVLYVATHFADRMPSENWIIMDDKRKIAAIHPKNEEFYVKELTEQEANRLLQTSEYIDEFVALWKEYFETIAIEERKNTACQRNHFPIWMRKHAVEWN